MADRASSGERSPLPAPSLTHTEESRGAPYINERRSGVRGEHGPLSYQLPVVSVKLAVA